MNRLKLILATFLMTLPALADSSPRSHEIFNFDWKFAYGHPSDAARDFNTGTGYFTYLAKAGYGDGATALAFDDRTWRDIDVPHDWAAEMPFDAKASHSHGYKTVGHGYPDTSVGWYRKHFFIPADDDGKRIFIEFDGVYRDAQVWVNGFYCGHEKSGYQSFSFDVSEFLNYGSDNVVAVRVDATMEEGWFYEGAGIYRNVWLTKTAPLYVPQYGTYVTSELDAQKAIVSARVKVTNKRLTASGFNIRNSIVDRTGNVVATNEADGDLHSMETSEFVCRLTVQNPVLWNLDHPNLYKLVTEILEDGKVVDVYKTTFGIRTIKWTPDKGFFLNGEHVKIKGTNNHQNHAGVGSAIPDALYQWRLRQLKEMGNNTYRTSHYPPSPALLDACDSIGMLVLDENRLMGTTDELLLQLKRLMERDRNHPSVVLWSIGNEEWMIEGNDRGARIAAFMQAFAKTIDSTRAINAAVSGNWNNGISTVIDVMGFNYLRHGSTDAIHEKNPWQASLGTEEGSTNTTRGIYFDDEEKQYLAAYDRDTPSGFFSIEHGWKHYAARDYLAGMCIWTGFDYRGESTPYTYPSVSTYFGMMDLCGFPKDNVYYLKSWWSKQDVLHILPHWNWPGKEGQLIDVWVYSNMDEVELFLNNKSLGRQKMAVNSHLSWQVKYKPGTLKAVGFKAGKKVLESKVETTGNPASVALSSDRNRIKADRRDLSVVTVSLKDKKGRDVPDANLPVSFSIAGPGKIIGVGNGDPASHEPDQFIDSIVTVPLINWVQKPLDEVSINDVIQPGFDAKLWEPALRDHGLDPGSKPVKMVFRGGFSLSSPLLSGKIEWMFRSVATNQSLYINGHEVAKAVRDDSDRYLFLLDQSMLHEGFNSVVIIGRPLVKTNPWDEMNNSPGSIKVSIDAKQWRRNTFNGLAQVLVQSTGEPGEIVLTATSPELDDAHLVIEAGK
ncbi:beta-galactosidase GalA [Geofilum sp. OHC36d9]|uniref:beta-galactosidase GalA n=1 Tax=Geofilum sp. OHC36d9 TaxID=3458413 RepID=UPI0040344BAD